MANARRNDELKEFRMREFIAITKALADESRVRILMALAHGELCLCQLIEMLGLAPSTVSKHMAVLTQAGLTECRKAGRWHYYRLADNKPGAKQEIQVTLDWVQAMTQDSPVVLGDRKRLQGISSKEIEEVSACYRG
jgi:DNA-binding transcriptional ArsR family regulator